jgi:hypothetical protein
LKEHLTLQECSISEGCRVQIVQRISGGGCWAEKPSLH